MAACVPAEAVGAEGEKLNACLAAAFLMREATLEHAKDAIWRAAF